MDTLTKMSLITRNSSRYIINLRQPQVQAVTESLLTIAISIILAQLAAIVLHSKLRRLSSGQLVYFTPNDFTEGIGHILVIVMARYVSCRGISVSLLAIGFAVVSSTSLLGTLEVRCSLGGFESTELTPIQNSTCYESDNRPGGSSVLGLHGTRLRELMTTDTAIDVRAHPLNFDVIRDQIVEFRHVTTELRGEAISAQECQHRVTFTLEYVVGVDSIEVSQLEGDPGKTAAPATSIQVNEFGLESDTLDKRVAVVYGKEVTNNGSTSVFLIYGYGERGQEGVFNDSRCVLLKHSSAGFMVLPFIEIASNLGSYDIDPIRLALVSWLAAGITQVSARQKPCQRGNYQIRMCTSISNNTVFSVITVFIIMIITSGWAVFNIFTTSRGTVKNITTTYQLFASAARDKVGQIDTGAKKPARTYVMQTNIDESGPVQFSWGTDEV